MRLLQIAAIASALMLMLAIAQNASAQEASAQGMPLSSMLSPDVLPIDPSRQMDTGLTVIRNADGSIGLAEAPDEAKRPLKLAFYDEFQPSDSRAFRSFISNNMMPAAASLLGRFIRVRYPSGLLRFNGQLDRDGNPIPPGPEAGGAYDADLVVRVVSLDPDSQECNSPIAFAFPGVFETLTRRPTFGEIFFCAIRPEIDFSINLQVVVHELLHVVGFSGALFATFFGYPRGEQDVVTVSLPPLGDYSYGVPADYPTAYTPDSGGSYEFYLSSYFGPAGAPRSAGVADYGIGMFAPGSSFAPGFDVMAFYDYTYTYTDGPAPAPAPIRALELLYYDGDPNPAMESVLDIVFGDPFPRAVITPNALREARLHFGCPTMESVLLEENFFRNGNHWSQRLYNGDIMRPRSTTRNFHNNREAMTDLTLGLFQDTGWYDVKYGSGGFNSYGYQAGCAFVNGTQEEAQADPAAARYLCTREQVGTKQCFHDFSGEGVCLAELLLGYDDFYSVGSLLDYTVDCQNMPGARCVPGSNMDDPDPICAEDVSCSVDGRVLIGNTPCSDITEGCPPDDFMCGDPGLLTCATPELNDCNGLGDCRQGRCFCHIGWGGADCSIRVCTTGCPDGSPCPASGFCGVPECGAWSVGDEGKGTPCVVN